MTNLLTLHYWFNLRPEPLASLGIKALIGLIILSLAASVLLFFVKQKKTLFRSFWIKLYNLFVTNIIICLFLLFFNFENAIFFSARFWFLLWFIIVIIWLINIFKSFRKIPSQKKQIKQEQEYRKYLP